MPDPTVNTAAGAFVVGLLTSLHCATMCGPWLCTALPRPSASYHAGRLLAYTSLGAAAGAVGHYPLRWLLKTPLAVLPWMLACLLLTVLLGWKPRLPKPIWLRKFTVRWSLRHGPARGFLLGLITPLLPCGPLYLVLAACLVSGSALLGAEFAFAFTLGTIPLLWLSQAGWGKLRTSISPQRMQLLQRSLAAVALAMVLWRLTAMPPDIPPACPLCVTTEVGP